MLATSVKQLCKSAQAFGRLGHIFGIGLEFRNLAVIMNLAFDPASNLIGPKPFTNINYVSQCSCHPDLFS